MRHAKTFLVAAGLLAALALPGFSQVGIYVGAFGGTSTQYPSAENVEFNADTTFVYGLRAGLKVLMVAVELNYFQAAHNILVGGGALLDWDQRVNNYSYIGLNGKIYFTIFMLKPFITAGYGYYTADIHNIETEKDGGINVGAGLDVKLGHRFSLTAEGRWQKVAMSIQNIQLSLGDFTLWAGLQFHF
ncbi:MAG: outer membrane beta-barrel protein [Acidobacteriota bacterium]|nr:outer membrane beta-barrel protein [Acidobacteriota bacterium]